MEKHKSAEIPEFTAVTLVIRGTTVDIMSDLNPVQLFRLLKSTIKIVLPQVDAYAYEIMNNNCHCPHCKDMREYWKEVLEERRSINLN